MAQYAVREERVCTRDFEVVYSLPPFELPYCLDLLEVVIKIGEVTPVAFDYGFESRSFTGRDEAYLFLELAYNIFTTDR